LRFDKVEGIDESLWEEIIKKSEYATVFHSLEWIKIQKEIFSIKEVLYYSDSCIFPVFIKKKGPFTIYGSPIPETGAFYGGPVCLHKNDYKGILSNLIKLGILSAFFIKTPNNFDISIFNNGFEIESVDNFIVDLKKPEDELWMNLNKKTRNAVRKAKKSNVSVEFCDVGYIDDYYRMVEEVSKRVSTVPIPKSFMERVVESGLGKLVIAFYDGRPASGGIFLTFKDTVTYWSGASHSSFRRYQPSNLLHWEVIKWARERYDYYDLGGAEIPRIAKFKKGWGGRPVKYYRVYREAPLAKAARILYSKLRKYPLISKFYRY